jgi:ABC-type amino acid transport substrate-binding protein
MMQDIYDKIERDCQFKSIPFAELIPSLVNDQSYLAVGGIAITPERAEKINFSRPYLPSYSLFLTHINFSAKKFELHLLDNKRIGVEEGSVFTRYIQGMNIKTPRIKTYRFESTMIESLSDKKIDVVLIDAASARYWAQHSHNILKTIGESIHYGFGSGIAINPGSPELIDPVNKALEEYKKSSEFKKHYDTHFSEEQIKPVVVYPRYIE